MIVKGLKVQGMERLQVFSSVSKIKA